MFLRSAQDYLLMVVVTLSIMHFGISVFNGEYGLESLFSVRAEIDAMSAEVVSLGLERDRLSRLIHQSISDGTNADIPDMYLRRTYSLIAEDELVITK